MQIVLIIISCIFNIISLYIYYDTFFSKEKYVSNIILMPTFFLSQLLTFFIPGMLHTNSESINTIFTMLLSISTLFLLTLFYHGRLLHRFFVSVTYFALGVLSELLIFVLFPISQQESLVTTEGNTNCLWNLISSFLTLIICIILNSLLRKRNDYSNTKYSSILILTPILSVISIIVAIDYPDERIYDISLFQLILIICLFIINAVHYFLFNFVVRTNKLALDNQLLQSQINYQTNKYQQISTAYRNTRSILHDTKKHFFFLKNCIDQENISALSSYLPEAIRKMDECYNKINTGNLVIDAFVSNFVSITEKEDIILKTTIKIDPAHISIKDYDLCIILGNLLDNSLMAVRKILPPHKKEISIHLFEKNRNFVIAISNSYFTDMTSVHSDDDLYHGYGCRNVEFIVNNANGTYTHYISDNTYISVVSIPYEVC